MLTDFFFKFSLEISVQKNIFKDKSILIFYKKSQHYHLSFQNIIIFHGKKILLKKKIKSFNEKSIKNFYQKVLKWQ